MAIAAPIQNTVTANTTTGTQICADPDTVLGDPSTTGAQNTTEYAVIVRASSGTHYLSGSGHGSSDDNDYTEAAFDFATDAATWPDYVKRSDLSSLYVYGSGSVYVQFVRRVA